MIPRYADRRGATSPDRDGDGILDAEEVMPIHTGVTTGSDPLIDLHPAPYEKDESGRYKTYSDYWGGERVYHDIDNADTRGWFIHDTGSRTEYLCLDPTNADTDGDGVNDGDELRDNDGDWPDDPDVGDYCFEEATNPLNPDTDGDGVIDEEDNFPNDKDKA